MTHPHSPDGGTIALLVLLAAVAYTAMAALGRRPWPWRRTVLFDIGCLVATAGLLGFSPWPTDDFRTHMTQHLMIGMLAPLALVLGAPVTLLLRTLPTPAGRAVGRMLRRRVVHAIADPYLAVVLNVGGLVLLYLTPLYLATLRSPPLHLLVHLHFLMSGCLLVWVLAGPDPVPRRPSVPAGLTILGAAVAVHATVAQLIYAGVLVDLPVPADQRRGGAELMYYLGDAAELLLAFALVTRRRPIHPVGPRSRAPDPQPNPGLPEARSRPDRSIGRHTVPAREPGPGHRRAG